MKRFGWRQWTLVISFALVVIVTGAFAVRTVRRTLYWRHHADEQIRPWMTLPYVAHSQHVPPPVLYDALGIPHQPHDRRPLREIARERKVSVDELIATLERTIEEFRQSHPAGASPSPDRGRSP
jgi:hypothetical protein